jgi:hypothetical protein
MKKILRLVTTSVLTLTLVACGEASSATSSSVSSSSGSSSVVSSNSAYANVTSITVSAATNQLTQVSNALKAVTVTAALNANTNPDTKLEWTINGVKSSQTSRTLEFTPNTSGTFKIRAKVGTVQSNEIEVSVTDPVFTISTVSAVTTSQLKVVAPAGASVTVSGKTLKDTSIYSLKDGAYYLDLNEALTQGQTVLVTIARDGFSPVTKSFTYDTRTLTLDTEETTLDGSYEDLEDLISADGTIVITRPFDDGVDFEKDLTLKFATENIYNGGQVTLNRTATVPTGATPFTPLTALVSADTNLDLSLTIDSDTPVGLYTYTSTVGPKTIVTKVQVVEPVAEILLDLDNYDSEDDERDPWDVAGLDLDFEDAPLLSKGQELVTFKDGVWEVTKPFNSYDPDEDWNFDFDVIARNFEYDQLVGGNYLSVSLVGPSALTGTVTTLFSGIETSDSELNSDNSSELVNLSYLSFESNPFDYGASETSTEVDIEQYFDYTSPVGLYTFTISAGTFEEVITKELKVRLVEPKPQLLVSAFDMIGTNNSTNNNVSNLENREFTVEEVSSNHFKVQKPSVAETELELSLVALLTNWQSSVVTDVNKIVEQSQLDLEDKTIYNLDTLLDIFEAEDLEELETDLNDLYVDVDDEYVIWSNENLPEEGLFYNFVNVELKVQGPGVLYTDENTILQSQSVKAAIHLDDQNDAITIWGLTKGSYLDDNDNEVDAEEISQTQLEDLFDLENLSALNHLELWGDEFEFHNPLGSIADEVLTIRKSTVPGTYTFTFKVDTLTTTLTLEVVEPTAQILALTSEDSSYDSETEYVSVNKTTTRKNWLGTPLVEDFEGDTDIPDELVSFLELDEDDVEFTNGKLTLYKSIEDNVSVFVDTLGIVDLTPGTYNYSVTKTYPDASSERYVGSVKFTSQSFDDLGLFAREISAVEDELDGVPLQDTDSNYFEHVAGSYFGQHFVLDEQNLQLGVTTIEFRIGSVSKTYTIEVLEEASINIETVKVNNTTLNLFNNTLYSPNEVNYYEVGAGFSIYSGNFVNNPTYLLNFEAILEEVARVIEGVSGYEVAAFHFEDYEEYDDFGEDYSSPSFAVELSNGEFIIWDYDLDGNLYFDRTQELEVILLEIDDVDFEGDLFVYIDGIIDGIYNDNFFEDDDITNDNLYIELGLSAEVNFTNIYQEMNYIVIPSEYSEDSEDSDLNLDFEDLEETDLEDYFETNFDEIASGIVKKDGKVTIDLQGLDGDLADSLDGDYVAMYIILFTLDEDTGLVVHDIEQLLVRLTYVTPVDGFGTISYTEDSPIEND